MKKFFSIALILSFMTASLPAVQAKEYKAPQKSGKRYKIADLPDAQRAMKKSQKGWPKWVRKVEEFVSIVAFLSLPFIFRGNTRASVSVTTPNVRVEVGEE